MSGRTLVGRRIVAGSLIIVGHSWVIQGVVLYGVTPWGRIPLGGVDRSIGEVMSFLSVVLVLFRSCM